MNRAFGKSLQNCKRLQNIILTLNLRATTESRKLCNGFSPGRQKRFLTLFFCLLFSTLSDATPVENTKNASDTQTATAESMTGSTNRIINYDKPFNEYTWVTAHNAYLDDMQSQLNRGVRAFMLDLYPLNLLAGQTVAMCHTSGSRCTVGGSKIFADEMNNTFLPFLRNNPNEIITLILESHISRELFESALKEIPGIENIVFSPDLLQNQTAWPTLRELISSGRRLIITTDGDLSANYTINGTHVTILHDHNDQIQNTYDLGGNALDHQWACETRWPPGITPAQPAKPCIAPNDPVGCPIPAKPETPFPGIPLKRSLMTYHLPGAERLFLMNQFHAVVKSQADAGNIDNNLTYLERRVEKYCKATAGERLVPNFIAIDYTNVGDAIPYAAALNNGGYYFYEDNNANTDQDTVCVLPAGQDYNIKLASHGCENDEARSLVLRGIAKGSRLTVFDSPEGNRQDDYSIIDVKRDIGLNERIVVGSFEKTQDTGDYSIRHFNNNGLDGKISRIHVEEHPADFSEAAIVLHEGNNGSQNIVCSVALTHPTTFNFGGDCDNDETRSATLSTARAGTVITLYGNWGSSNCDQGCSTIEVKHDITWPTTIGTYEGSYETDDLKVTRSGGNQQLDGKISSVRVAFEPAPPDTTAPSIPSLHPEPLNLTGTSATVQWVGATDNVAVTGYTLFINNSPPLTTTGTSYTFTALSDLSSYRVVVRAKDAAGNYSAPATMQFSTPDATAPTLPGDPEVTNSTPTSATIRWTESKDNVAVTSYTVSLNRAAPVTVTGTNYTFTGLNDSISYAVEIKASDAAGNNSSPATLYFTLPDESAPTQPGKPVVSNLNGTSATVSWTAATDNTSVTGYAVSLNSAPAITVKDPRHLFTSLSPNFSYKVDVKAQDAAGNLSPASSVVFVSRAPDNSAPTQPGPPVITEITSTSAKVSWRASTDNVAVTGYTVQLDNAPPVAVTRTSHTFTNLSEFTTYRAYVKAKDAAENYSGHNNSSFRTLDATAPAQPGTPVASNFTSTSATLSWPASIDNVAVTGYTVSINNALPISVIAPEYHFNDSKEAVSYTVEVKAKDAAGNLSAPVSFRFRTPDTSAPTRPGTPVASAIAGTSATISWPESTDNVAVTGYTVSINNTPAITVAAPQHTFIDLQGGASYSIEVKAKDAAENFSAPVSFDFLTPDTTAPTQPGKLIISNITRTSAKVTWPSSTDNVAVTGYEVFLKPGTKTFVAGNSHTFTNLGIPYSFAVDVRAKDAAGNVSPMTSEIFKLQQ
ncbi:hypothetical protein PS862_05683 [Pseudomonas fluorescens]|uniref:Fibronectin type-III domain-containing protein n=1 Tax=Pseudomonas fluorescens TaxID=294 RepID=A0A5E7PZY0_PSEFL|nr:fibronectin type III domain-containing protein [Pseudomonas fluorescens]VVP55412.1 hypothetical protein PS862_05683 [Pseudomonas fluorescens]